MHSLLLDFLKVTESAALAAFPWIGSGDKFSADQSATTAMRNKFNKMQMSGTIVIGEGEIDEAPMLYIGENLGLAHEPKIDIAVDPIDGTTPIVDGQSNAITVMAAAPEGSLLHAPDMYMEKLAVGPEAKGKVNINSSLLENMKAVAKSKKKNLNELNVCIQDRPRHKEYIQTVRENSAKAILFQDGDVIRSIATCIDSTDIDLFVGIGGAPEGVLSAVAIKGLGGEMQGRLIPRNEIEVERCKEMGVGNPEAGLSHNELINSDDCVFIATGITENMYLNGIDTKNNKHIVHSLLIDGKEKRRRFIESEYPLINQEVV